MNCSMVLPTSGIAACACSMPNPSRPARLVQGPPVRPALTNGDGRRNRPRVSTYLSVLVPIPPNRVTERVSSGSSVNLWGQAYREKVRTLVYPRRQTPNSRADRGPQTRRGGADAGSDGSGRARRGDQGSERRGMLAPVDRRGREDEPRTRPTDRPAPTTTRIAGRPAAPAGRHHP